MSYHRALSGPVKHISTTTFEPLTPERKKAPKKWPMPPLTGVGACCQSCARGGRCESHVPMGDIGNSAVAIAFLVGAAYFAMRYAVKG